MLKFACKFPDHRSSRHAKETIFWIFLTNRVQLRENEEKETIKKILKFWEQQSFIVEDGRRIVEIGDNAIIILKGFDP